MNEVHLYNRFRPILVLKGAGYRHRFYDAYDRKVYFMLQL